MEQDGAFLVLFKNEKRDRVFLVRRSDYYTWGLTGGAVEEGETPEKAAVREAVEETGFEVKITRLVGDYQIINKKGRKLRKTYLFEGRVISGEFKPEFPGCRGKWLAVNSLPLNMLRATRAKIADAKNHKGRVPFHKVRRDGTVWDDLHLLLVNPIGAIKAAKKFLS
jgi:8-oxo-dGTP diphosphatase